MALGARLVLVPTVHAPTRRRFDPADWHLQDMSPRQGWQRLFRR